MCVKKRSMFILKRVCVCVCVSRKGVQMHICKRGVCKSRKGECICLEKGCVCTAIQWVCAPRKEVCVYLKKGCPCAYVYKRCVCLEKGCMSIKGGLFQEKVGVFVYKRYACVSICISRLF